MLAVSDNNPHGNNTLFIFLLFVDIVCTCTFALAPLNFLMAICDNPIIY